MRAHFASKDVAIGSGLFLFTVVSRLPFRSQILYHWDSVNFANGMQRFDMLQEHPQPPGYIVYVWMCRLLDLVFYDANASMIVLSIIASSLAVVMIYLLGRTMWDARVGLISALLLASSPLFWFYGEIALPHTVDAFLVLASVWLLFHVRQGDKRFFWPAVGLLSIAGGVRPQTLVFLLPLTLFAAWRVGWPQLLAGGTFGAGLCLVWLVPLLVSCGGLGGYLDKMANFTARFQSTTSVLMGAGWPGVMRNLGKLLPYTAYGLAAGVLPLGLFALRKTGQDTECHGVHCGFLMLWIGPVLLFYIFIHMGQQGLILTYLPALLLMAGHGLVSDRISHRAAWLLGAGLVIFNVGIFCLVPEYPLGPGTQRLLTRDTLINSDVYYQDRFDAIRAHFDPGSTYIFAANWEHARYYLPEYSIVEFHDDHMAFPNSPLDGMARLSALVGEATVVVLFDPDIVDRLDVRSSVHQVPLARGGELHYLPTQNRRSTLYPSSHLYSGACFFGERPTDL